MKLVARFIGVLVLVNAILLSATGIAAAGFQQTGLATAQAQLRVGDPASTVVVSGRLTDAQGNGLAGVGMLFSGPGGGGYAQTDDTGSYSVATPAGDNTLYITGYGTTSVPDMPGSYSLQIQLTIAGATTLNIKLPVQQLSIHVVDTAGNPVPNVYVSVGNDSMEPIIFSADTSLGALSASLTMFSGSATSDASGDAVVWVFPTTSAGGNYHIDAAPASGTPFLLASLANISVPADTSATVRLQPAILVSGKLTDGQGTALAGQVMQFFNGRNVGQGQTDGAGNYSVATAPGDNTLIIMGTNTTSAADNPGAYTLQMPVTIGGNARLDISLPVKKLSVHVVDAAGQPVTNATVSAYDYNGQTHDFSASKTLGALPASVTMFSGSAPTDLSGNAVVRLFPTTTPGISYNVDAYLVLGDLSTTTHATISDFTSDQSMVMALPTTQVAHAAPATGAALTPAPDAAGMYADPVTVSLSATAAPGFAVAATSYSVDKGPAQLYSAPFLVSGSGAHTLQYWSVDNTGIREAPVTLSIAIGGNTPSGSNVAVTPAAGVELNFSSVSSPGSTTVATSSTGPTPPAGFTLSSVPVFYDIQTSAAYATPIEVCIAYDAAQTVDPANLRLLHYTAGAWQDVTTSNDVTRSTICGQVTSLSPFVVAQRNLPAVVGPVAAPADPVAVNTSIAASAAFTDSGVQDSHTADWDWGDGSTSAGTVTEADGAGSVAGSHSYPAAGVYTLKLTVTDNGGASGQAVFQYVVVYDPGAGFVTGGGWFTSPAGAAASGPALTGRLNIGFTARYQKGTTAPTGQTQFDFQAAKLNFHSTSYQWLVIAGAKAQYRGAGTINGAGNYSFSVTVSDGSSSGAADKVRLKVWDSASGAIVYDTQPGAADAADPTTPLEGGNIAIHS